MHSPLYLSSILLSIVTAVHATVRDVDAQTMGRFDDQMHEMDLDGNGSDYLSHLLRPPLQHFRGESTLFRSS